MKERIINTLIWSAIIVLVISIVVSIVIAIFVYPKYSFIAFALITVLTIGFGMSKDSPIYVSKSKNKTQ